MAHVYVLAEGRKVWTDLFLKDLTMRRYPYKDMDGRLRFGQPNAREVKLLDISLPQQSIRYLLEDLSPYVDVNSPSKKRAYLGGSVLRTLLGLNSLNDLKKDHWLYKIPLIGKIVAGFLSKEEKVAPSKEVRKRWMNVMPLGWHEDPKHAESEWRFLPEGGELI